MIPVAESLCGRLCSNGRNAIKVININFRSVYSDVLIWFNQVFHFKNGWILLPGLMAVLLVYNAYHFNVCTRLLSRASLEYLALFLVSMILVILASKSLISRDPLIIYLAVLTLVFLVRELDDTALNLFGSTYMIKSKKLVYFLLFCMSLWALGWHEKLSSCLNRSMILSVSLFGVLWTYLFSQLIAHRVFRGILPNESLMHVILEETVETAAHLFFLVFALLLSIPKRK